MSGRERLSGNLQRAFAGDAWYGPSLTEILDGVDARAAAARPLPGAHSF